MLRKVLNIYKELGIKIKYLFKDNIFNGRTYATYYKGVVTLHKKAYDRFLTETLIHELVHALDFKHIKNNTYRKLPARRKRNRILATLKNNEAIRLAEKYKHKRKDDAYLRYRMEKCEMLAFYVTYVICKKYNICHNNSNIHMVYTPVGSDLEYANSIMNFIDYHLSK